MIYLLDALAPRGAGRWTGACHQCWTRVPCAIACTQSARQLIGVVTRPRNTPQPDREQAPRGTRLPARSHARGQSGSTARRRPALRV